MKSFFINNIAEVHELAEVEFIFLGVYSDVELAECEIYVAFDFG